MRKWYYPHFWCVQVTGAAELIQNTGLPPWDMILWHQHQLWCLRVWGEKPFYKPLGSLPTKRWFCQTLHNCFMVISFFLNLQGIWRPPHRVYKLSVPVLSQHFQTLTYAWVKRMLLLPRSSIVFFRSISFHLCGWYRVARNVFSVFSAEVHIPAQLHQLLCYPLHRLSIFAVFHSCSTNIFPWILFSFFWDWKAVVYQVDGLEHACLTPSTAPNIRILGKCEQHLQTIQWRSIQATGETPITRRQSISTSITNGRCPDLKRVFWLGGRHR